MKSFYIVADMNVAFGNLQGDKENIDWARIESQCKNIPDEMAELEGSLNGKGSLNEVRDALVDIQVFAYGAFHLMGYDGNEKIVSFIERNPINQQVQSLTEFVEECYTVLELNKHNVNVLMKSFRNPKDYINIELILEALTTIIYNCILLQKQLELDPDEEMQAVIDSVMTRFCGNEKELGETIELWKTKGVNQIYVEGEFPRKIVKSLVDQPDAPKGKFLKSVGCKKPIFSKCNPSWHSF